MRTTRDGRSGDFHDSELVKISVRGSTRTYQSSASGWSCFTLVPLAYTLVPLCYASPGEFTRHGLAFVVALTVVSLWGLCFFVLFCFFCFFLRSVR